MQPSYLRYYNAYSIRHYRNAVESNQAKGYVNAKLH
ncbi:Uncharacterised protein [Mobiluncus mulieris]|uniref:Uncharacterized protein n=1 Tax=Mobiluncus mulieris TaxID=2052 RepID=A0A8G2HS38_9ACTO|nr:Uncharacterised protein [Mobiluncus mulieris]